MHRARRTRSSGTLAGVGAVRRGEGIGSALLRHRLDRPEGPAYLESSKQENIPLYERFGFELRDTIPCATGRSCGRCGGPADPRRKGDSP